MKSKLRMAGIALLAVVGLWSCNDSPTEPEPNNGRSTGRAYLAVSGAGEGLYVVDLETDSVLSYATSTSYASRVEVTSDGRYVIARCDGDNIIVFNAGDLSIVKSVPPLGAYQLVHGDSAIVTKWYSEFSLLSFPEFKALRERELPIRTSTGYSPHTGWVYGFRGADTLAAISPDSLEIVDQWIVHSSRGSEFYLYDWAFSADDHYAYLTAAGSSGALFITYDLRTRQIVATHPINAPFGRIAVSPNGKEVWVTDPFSAGMPFVSEGIWVFDGRTGQYLRTVSLRGYLPSDSTEPLIARAIEFAPDGKNVIVGTGDYITQRGTVLRISTITNKVEKIYFPDFDLNPSDVSIGKKP